MDFTENDKRLPAMFDGIKLTEAYERFKIKNEYRKEKKMYFNESAEAFFNFLLRECNPPKIN